MTVDPAKYLTRFGFVIAALLEIGGASGGRVKNKDSICSFFKVFSRRELKNQTMCGWGAGELEKSLLNYLLVNKGLYREGSPGCS